MDFQPYRPVAIYLRPNYLTKVFSASERLRCHVHAYSFLCERFSPLRLLEIFEPGVALLSREAEGRTARCLFAGERRASNQSELSLTLRLDEEDIYALGFGFAPADVFGLEGDTVLLVSRMQGLADSFESLRAATKMLGDMSPQTLLFAALQGFAERFAIRHVVGVSAQVQCSFEPGKAEALRRVYDDFFESVGAVAAPRGFYVYDRAAFADIYENLPAKHRARAKARRRAKTALAAETFAALAPYVRLESGAELFPAAYLSSHAGELRNNRIVATGKAGCLLFGPYVRLEAGAYVAAFLLEGGAEPAPLTLDVSADQGQARLAREEHVWTPGAPAEIGFELAEPRTNVEFRLFVKAGATLATRGVALRRL